jgi:hypothetical protein
MQLDNGDNPMAGHQGDQGTCPCNPCYGSCSSGVPVGVGVGVCNNTGAVTGLPPTTESRLSLPQRKLEMASPLWLPIATRPARVRFSITSSPDSLLLSLLHPFWCLSRPRRTLPPIPPTRSSLHSTSSHYCRRTPHPLTSSPSLSQTSTERRCILPPRSKPRSLTPLLFDLSSPAMSC